MRFSPLVDRISSTGAGAWGVHMEAARRRDAGEDIIFLTIGDPDQAAPGPVVEATIASLRQGRTGYTPIIGYPRVREASPRAAAADRPPMQRRPRGADAGNPRRPLLRAALSRRTR